MALSSAPDGPVCLLEVPPELASRGLRLRREAITEAEEAALVACIDGSKWDDQTLSRRTQHYGHRFDYRTKLCVPASEAIPAPVWRIFQRLLPDWYDDAPRAAPGPLDAMTVNEYVENQGIAPHVDSHAAYSAGGITVLSLNGTVSMRFRECFKNTTADDATPRGDDDRETPRRKPPPPPSTEIFLPRRSVLELTGEVRLAYTHAIQTRKGDLVGAEGAWVRRHRRISLTFRTVPAPGTYCDCRFPEWCDGRADSSNEKYLPTRLPPVCADAPAPSNLVRPVS